MTQAAYRRSETGRVMLAILLGAAAVTAAVALLGYARAGALYAFAFPPLFALAAANFYKLTVTIDEEKVAASFGIGLISKTVRLADIASAEIARETWYGGWGLRWTGKGWFYTVGSLDAVALNLKDGSEFLIGTEEPQALLAAVTARLKTL